MEKDEKINVEENQEINKTKKQSIIPAVLMAIFIPIISIVLILVAIFAYKDYKKKEEFESYKEKVEEYLTENYDDKFNIELQEEGYEKQKYSIDATSFYCGHDKNIREFIFKVSPKENEKIKFFVGVRHNIEENEDEVIEFDDYEGESYAIEGASNLLSYKNALKCYEEKQEIKSQLESYLNDDYNINYYSDAKKIIAKSNRSFEYLYKENPERYLAMCNELLELVEGKEIYIELKYKEGTVEGDGDSIIISSTYKIPEEEQTNSFEYVIKRIELDENKNEIGE